MGERFAAASRPGPSDKGSRALQDTALGLSPGPQLTRRRRLKGLEVPGEKATIRLSPHSPLRGPLPC